MPELIKEYLEELELCKDVFSNIRYRWLLSIANETTTKDKIICARGYLMAVSEMVDRKVLNLSSCLGNILSVYDELYEEGF